MFYDFSVILLQTLSLCLVIFASGNNTTKVLLFRIFRIKEKLIKKKRKLIYYIHADDH